MPLYEYACGQCGHQFDKLTRMGTPDAEIACPTCDAHDAQRMISVFAVGRSSSAPPATPCGKPPEMCCNPGGCGFEA